MKKKPNRTTTIYIGGIQKEIDVDQNWDDLLSSATPLGRVSCPFHFSIHLKHLDMPEEIKTRFLTHYAAPAAVKARNVAIYGLAATNAENELSIIQHAMDFHENRIEGFYADKPESVIVNHMLLFAMQFAEIVHKRDSASLRRMFKIIESWRLPSNERGGIGSVDSYMFEKFVELHIDNRSLPTKMALRNACGLGDRVDEKIAAKRMRKLGLWGLPTEPEI